MENGQTTWAGLSDEIKALDRVRVRFALINVEAEWHLFTAVVDDLPESTQDGWNDYDYGPVAFVQGEVRGSELVDWINGSEGQLRQSRFRIPSVQPSINWSRYPSHTHFGYVGAGVPFTNYQLHATQGRPQVPNNLGFLVSNAAPFFPDFNTAVWRLLFDAIDQTRSGQVPSELMDVRLADRRAWIDLVHLGPTSMTVRVVGDDVPGVRLEVYAAPDLRLSERVERAGDAIVPLPSGVPQGTWIVLSRDRTVLDYRQLVPPGVYGPRVDNLTVEVAASTRLEQLISGGEGDTTEFKLQVSGVNTDRLLRTVAAFANGEGGVLLIGVDDNGTVVGVSQSVGEEKDRITNMIRSTITPEPPIRLEDGKVNGKDIVAVRVDKGMSPPYGLLPEPPKFYVRRGATTFPARQEEIRVLGQRNAPAPDRDR